jgi:PKD repeat protein
MRQQLLYKLVFSFLFLNYTIGFGQILSKPSTSSPVNGNLAKTESFLHYSPDFHHEHDGEKCLQDALTADWIEKAGITEKYRAEEAYQSNLASTRTGGDRSTYTIPVIFHVVYNTPAENLSEADILDLLAGVNEDFSASNPDIGEARGGFGFIPFNADVEFCLAKQNEIGVPLVEYGIHRVPTTEVWFNPDTETNKMKGSDGGDTGTEGWDRDRYLNIWICDITNGAGSGVAGYAYKPTIGSLPPAAIDGIVIDYNLGTNPATHVLSHEIGHFLGLDHTWGGGAGSCGTDDGLADTPNNAGPSFDYAGSCSGSQMTCPGIQTQYENFMDYSNCTVMFTEDQVNLMHLVMEGSRAELTTSDVCDTPFPMPPVANFVADITTVIETGSVNFTDLSTNYPTTWSWTVSPMTGVSFIGGTSAASENPVIQFNSAGLKTITLVASNGEGSDTEVKTNYISVIEGGAGAASCDTLRNYTSDEFDNLAYYSVGTEAGYYPSLLTLDAGAVRVDAYAEFFTAPGPTFVKRIRVPILQVDDIGGASNVTFRVWSDASGEPGAILGSKVVPLSDLDEGFINTIDFTTGIAVTGNFWVGMVLNYGAGFDTVVFATTNFDDRPSGTSTTSCLITGGVGWTRTSDVFLGSPDCSLIMDVLTSNGPDPVAVVSFPVTETCEGMEVTMNGFGSLNTTSYYWDISDGVDDYFYDEANLTATFDAGTWTIQLIADGSCESDLSDVYTLTVNPAMNVTKTITPENCSDADGIITFNATGGDGAPYQYSINDGASFVGTSTFTDLTANTYNFVVKDDANCEFSGVAVVTNINSFSPSISPDVVIAPGESVDLTVTGGSFWTWYAGATYVGNTATVTVAPLVTTTYVCNVIDDSGCEVSLDVTVFADDGSGIVGIDLDKSLDIFPNPTADEINVRFNLIEAKDLSIRFVSVIGEEVVSERYTNISNNTLTFDLSQLAKGVYFAVIESENETVTKKIVLR